MQAIRFDVIRVAAAAAILASPGLAATFGRVVPIGGHASDIALDESRGVLYIANYTANRIDVMSLADNTISRSLNVAAMPGALALSPDGQFLMVAHFAPFEPPATSGNALTLIHLADNTRQVFSLGQPPLGVAFGRDGLALIATTTDFILFDPLSGATQVIGSLAEITAKALPAELATYPPQIIQASITATADRSRIYGIVDTFKSNDDQTQAIRFSYNVMKKKLISLGLVAVPALGPRVLSVSQDGSYYMAGWGLFGCDFRLHGDCDISGPLIAEFPNALGDLEVGSHAIDSKSGTIYAQMPEAVSNEAGSAAALPAPVLLILDADNLTVRERIRLPENLGGRSVLNADASVLYSVSESGVMVLPVGRLGRAPRLAASQEDVVFRSNSCARDTATQQFVIRDLSGGAVPFSLSASVPGIDLWPSSGTTPATITVRADPAVFQNQKGTVTARIDIRSSSAVNVPVPVRVLVNTRDPDQRGTFINVPGKLVDLLTDPLRNRFYILRQDRNEVLVFESSGYTQIATLRTSNTPTQMAFTLDRRYLLIGHNDSQLAYVYDLETLQQEPPIRFQLGHYPRSLASSGRTLLAACRVAGPEHTIDRVDFANRTAAPLSSLGIYKNSVHVNTVLEAAPNGGSVLAAMPDGNLMLYDADADTFTVSRKLPSTIDGAYAASSYGVYVVGNNILNSSLVPAGKLDSSAGAPSGFAFVDQYGIRTMRAAAGNGNIQRVNLAQSEAVLSTRMVEAPLRTAGDSAFTRTLAALADRSGLIALTTSGFTVLPWNYDAAVAPPRLERVVNAADLTEAVAPGSLVSVFGNDLSPLTVATREVPVPTALADSCLTVNGMAVPMLFASSTRINAQVPYNIDGNVRMVLRTPGGVSDSLNFTVVPAAPSIFRSGTAGPDTGIATVVRERNSELVTPSNPIHPDDRIVIYLTGLGKTSPSVEAGMPAPSDPLATALIQPEVTLNGAPLLILYAGLAPGQVGVYQINAIVPFRGVQTGFSVPLTINQGGATTTVLVRVVD